MDKDTNTWAWEWKHVEDYYVIEERKWRQPWRRGKVRNQLDRKTGLADREATKQLTSWTDRHAAKKAGENDKN